MDELLFQSPGFATGESSLFVATVATKTSSGTTLIFDGQNNASQKRYKSLVTGNTLAAGDRVLVARLSGTCIVLGKISN